LTRWAARRLISARPPLFRLNFPDGQFLSNLYGAARTLVLTLNSQVRKTGTGNLSTQQVRSRKTDAPFAEAIISLIGGRQADPVIVVGPRHIELVVQLVYHGFLDVTCRSLLNGPSLGAGSAGIIIVPAADRVPERATVLPRLARALQPGGALFVCCSGGSSAVRLRQLQRLLRQRGIAFVRMRLKPQDLDVLCCHRAAAFAAEAA
jgi:hypothetical protein